jgi:hypothetical protein
MNAANEMVRLACSGASHFRTPPNKYRLAVTVRVRQPYLHLRDYYSAAHVLGNPQQLIVLSVSLGNQRDRFPESDKKLAIRAQFFLTRRNWRLARG